jgi:hypothetical protein
MTPKNVQLSFMVANLLFVLMNFTFIVTGHATWFTVLVILINLYAAKVCYDGYKRSSN